MSDNETVEGTAQAEPFTVSTAAIQAAQNRFAYTMPVAVTSAILASRRGTDWTAFGATVPMVSLRTPPNYAAQDGETIGLVAAIASHVYGIESGDVWHNAVIESGDVTNAYLDVVNRDKADKDKDTVDTVRETVDSALWSIVIHNARTAFSRAWRPDILDTSQRGGLTACAMPDGRNGEPQPIAYLTGSDRKGVCEGRRKSLFQDMPAGSCFMLARFANSEDSTSEYLLAADSIDTALQVRANYPRAHLSILTLDGEHK